MRVSWSFFPSWIPWTSFNQCVHKMLWCWAICVYYISFLQGVKQVCGAHSHEAQVQIKFSDRLQCNLKLKEIFCKSHNPWSADCLKILLGLHLRRWKQSHDVLFLPTESNNLSSSFQAKKFQWNADWINCFSICMIGPKIIFAQRLWTNKKLPSFNFFHPGIYWWKLFQMPLVIYN